MERTDLLKPADKVSVTVWGPDDSCLYRSSGEGYHKIEEAINDAVSNADLKINPEDCVFEVSNDTTGVSHRYRINAHGNLKLIV